MGLTYLNPLDSPFSHETNKYIYIYIYIYIYHKKKKLNCRNSFYLPYNNWDNLLII